MSEEFDDSDYSEEDLYAVFLMIKICRKGRSTE